MEFDYLVIGGGSGGLASAIQAAKLGAKVAIVEPSELGGTCVNRGCIPKKALWLASSTFKNIQDSENYITKPKNNSFIWSKFIKKRDKYINNIHKSYNRQLKKLGISHIEGYAKLVNANTVVIDSKKYIAKYILLAAGAKPTIPDLPGHEFGITSDDFFKLKKQPEKVIVVGGGYIGVELACSLNALGSKVTLILNHDLILNGFDKLLAENLQIIMQKDKIKILPEKVITKINNVGKNVKVYLAKQIKPLEAECLIWAIGRTPSSANLGLNDLFIKTDQNKFIEINNRHQTSIDNIYAVGDITKYPALTPVAIKAGRSIANNLFGSKKVIINYQLVPTVVFSHPPLASIGLTEELAKKKYKDIKIYQKNFISMNANFSKKLTETTMRLITTGTRERIVGCHILGQNVDEILQGFSVAITMGVTKADFEKTFAIHPTIAEELLLIE